MTLPSYRSTAMSFSKLNLNLRTYFIVFKNVNVNIWRVKVCPDDENEIRC